jgi:16S rRNA (uracil1498-N3)-methyltransferase
MRRILVPKATVGRIDLAGPQTHHLRDVLRLKTGEKVEVFDEAGVGGRGRILSVTPAGVSIEVDEIVPGNGSGPALTIAAAIPKGARADWMVEKLSELGVEALVPLCSRRSVVLPQGGGKPDRWRRLAAAAAEQSGRTGVMRIESLTKLPVVIERAKAAGSAIWHLSLDEAAVPIVQLISALPGSLTVLVGPEGGWSAEEAGALGAAGVVPVRLTRTILRVETAAVSAAAIIQSALTLGLPRPNILRDNASKPS